MKRKCPKCSAATKNIVKFGQYYRKSDSKTIQRFKCLTCKKQRVISNLSINTKGGQFLKIKAN